MYMYYKDPSALTVSQYCCTKPLQGASPTFCGILWNTGLRQLCLSSLFAKVLESPTCHLGYFLLQKKAMTNIFQSLLDLLKRNNTS